MGLDSDLQSISLSNDRDGRVAKWLERLTAVRNIDGSSQTLGS